MCSRIAFIALAALLSFWRGPALAEAGNAGRPLPASGSYGSATEAYREGIAAFRSGNVRQGLPALTYAADRGVLGAQLRLAETYASGREVPRDDGKAYGYFRQIADSYAEIAPGSPVAKYIAEAFVALGRYQLTGVPEIGLKPNPVRAADLFRHAASYFGSAEAQYELARLYLSGTGVRRDLRLGASWLAMSARKQHAASQATLGEMLWRGEPERRRYIKGLALIALAHHNASAAGDEPEWIGELYLEAFKDVDDETRVAAEAAIPRWGGPKLAIAPLNPPIPETVTASDPLPLGARIGGFLFGQSGGAEEAEAALSREKPAPSQVPNGAVTAGTAPMTDLDAAAAPTSVAAPGAMPGAYDAMPGGTGDSMGLSLGFGGGSSASSLQP